ncbi:MAG: DUF4011 domain-containing protein [Deltaproteobacteria bacterium]|jgi:very-short-patch-repair endonuclease|nr:DUF4011 domain-containing protein [Deltaproteobacteria bacterium]
MEESASVQSQLIRSKLATLRKKVIDLSNRNPLVNVSLSPRSGAIVRVVDELPEVLAYKLRQRQAMTFKALPPIDENNPTDEKTAKFKAYLNAMKAEDPEYLDFISSQTIGGMATPEESEREERKLKDKVRVILKLPPRKTQANFNLDGHARDCGIDPSFELPTPQQAKEPKREDDEIQTLFLPSAMDRQLTTLITKCRTWEEETGINAFHAAFGLLRWQDSSAKDRQVNSPLVLLPVRLDLKRSSKGPKFFVSADDDCALNFVISEKLKLEHSIELPEFEPGDKIEDYFLKVRQTISGRPNWDISRQVIFGIFPSARMSIYHDLHPDKIWYSQNPIMTDLLCGRQMDTAVQTAANHDVDDPRIDNAVNPLVLSADSSQVSAVYDALSGKNMALEGPPGTGKSQSIVNLIAAALKKGLKVLFVAEKMAALEVVKSRLEAIGLGGFLLPLQANRSERAQVFAGIRSRVYMAPPEAPEDPTPLYKLLNQSRQKINEYIKLMSEPFGTTGFSLRDVLGRFRATDARLAEAPKALASPTFDNLETFDRYKIEALLSAVNDLGQAASEAAAAAGHWQGVTVTDLDAFSAQRIKDEATDLAKAFSEIQARKAEMSVFALDDLTDGEIDLALDFLGRLAPVYPNLDRDSIDRLSQPENLETVLGFFKKLARYGFLKEGLSNLLLWPDSPETLERLNQAADMASNAGFKSLDWESERQELQALNDALNLLRTDESNLAPLIDAAPKLAGASLGAGDLATRSFATMAAVREHVTAYDPRVLGLRMPTPPSATLLGQLQYLINQGRFLRDHETKLSGTFPLRTSPNLFADPNSLIQAASELQNGGLLRRFSRGFRKAKAFFLTLTNGAKFEPNSAAFALNELAGFIASLRSFEQNQQLRAAFPTVFYGLRSDFSLMSAILDYYLGIERKFPGLANQEIRDILWFEDASLLSSIPIPLSPAALKAGPQILEVPDNYRDLVQTLAETRALYGRRAEAFESLGKLLYPEQGQALIKGDFGAVNAFMAQAWDTTLSPPASGAAASPNPSGGTPDYPGLASARRFIGLVKECFDLKADLAGDAKARELLGAKFNGPETSGESLKLELWALELIGSAGPNGGDLYRALANPRSGELAGILSDVAQKLKKVEASLAALKTLTGLDLSPALAALPPDGSPGRASELASELAEDQAGLFAHSGLVKAKAKLAALGLGWFVAAHEAENRPLTGLAPVLEATIYRAMALKVRESRSQDLLAFSASELNRYRETLARKDADLSKWAQRDLAHGLHRLAQPPLGNSVGLKKDYTEYSLLLNEVGKKKQFIPIRRLISRAARALMEIKPCWMMSPTAVSQYLTDQNVLFDLGILDEASQMPPENAIPSLARCRQIVIVGDTNQLPPTNFFQKNVLGETALDDDEAEGEAIEESILDLAKTIYVPMRRLKWHYRSRHSGLINFCNRVIYDDELVVYPSPSEKRPDMGVSLVKANGLYQKSQNPIEAQTMVKWALEHMLSDSDRSLGMVTFNEKQRNFIIDLMERAIEANDYAMKYVEKWKAKNDGLETFFVKNLENVQGDERDVIFIGTVYGPEKTGGPVAQRFGPVSGASGRRRLNVLFSRAKQKIVTFTSMTPADVRANPGDLTGTAMLKEWLAYCEMGGTGQTFVRETKNTDSEPSLENYVLSQVEGLGYAVDRRVGTEGYKLDLAAKSESYPLGYLMGLESDGESYDRDVSDRDRDRLRPEVLSGLGWKLARLWTGAWYANPQGELAALKAELEKNLSEAQASLAKLPPPRQHRPDPAGPLGPDGDLPDTPKDDSDSESPESLESPDDFGPTGDRPAPTDDQPAGPETAKRVAVGDRVTVRYLDEPQKVKEILITESENDPEKNHYAKTSPLGRVLMDQEEEDEVQLLIKNSVQSILIESIVKAAPADGTGLSEPTLSNPALPDLARPAKVTDNGQDGTNGDEPDGFAALVAVKLEDASRLTDTDYRDALSELTLRLIDGLGPIKLETLSQALTKAHGFSRRGANIDRAVAQAIGNKRKKTATPDHEVVYWPPNMEPANVTDFRGLTVAGIRRGLKQIPYPELLGLAMTIVGSFPTDRQIPAMASHLEIARLAKSTRNKLAEVLKMAQKLKN